jgi:uncharacterized membrane protein
MLDHLLYALTLASALGTGLIAGVFFAFSSFVMGALARLAPPQGIAAMQSINVVVLNPMFLGTFMGTAALCVVLGVAAVLAWASPAAPALLAGALLYLVGTLLVTVVCNVPRNEVLARVEPDAAGADRLWQDYLRTWTGWNHVRTVSALAAAAAFIVALDLSGSRV